jgi:hypothetical protein
MLAEVGLGVSAKLHEISFAGKQQTLFAGVHAIGACDGGPQLNLDVLTRAAYGHPLFLTEFVSLFLVGHARPP